MLPFSLLVKPVGSRCNLGCRYCFYKGKGEGVMTEAVFERMLETYLGLSFSSKSVALQGGEPLLAPGWVFDVLGAAPVERSLQTNATLITRRVAERLAAGRWLVGASVDGPEGLNDAMRGSGVFRSAVRGIRHLEDCGVDYNLLAVVSRHNVSRPGEVYRFLRDTFKTRFHQYIECTGPDPAFAITGEEWGDFLCRLFDEWERDAAAGISIRLFESTLSALLRGYPTQCTQSAHCRHHLVVEHDGSVYPCDFFVKGELRLGNVMTHSWEQMLSSATYRRFIDAKSEALPMKCLRCEFLGLCYGDCPRSRQSLCEGYRRFYAHAVPVLLEIAGQSNAEG